MRRLTCVIAAFIAAAPVGCGGGNPSQTGPIEPANQQIPKANPDSAPAPPTPTPPPVATNVPWSQVVSAKQGFAVQIPGDVKVHDNSVKEVPGEIDTIIIEIMGAEAADKSAYSAMMTRAKAPPGQKIDNNAVAEKVLTNFVAKFRGTISKKTPVVLDDLPGIEASFSGPNVIGRIAVAYGRDHLIQLGVLGPPTNRHVDNAGKFFSSLKKLTKTSPPIGTTPSPAPKEVSVDVAIAEATKAEAKAKLKGPDEGVQWLVAANWWLSAKDESKARAALKQGLNVGPGKTRSSTIAFYERAGNAYMTLGDTNAAIQQYETGIAAVGPNVGTVLNSRLKAAKQKLNSK